jgi:hypothetical protein
MQNKTMTGQDMGCGCGHADLSIPHILPWAQHEVELVP